MLCETQYRCECEYVFAFAPQRYQNIKWMKNVMRI